MSDTKEPTKECTGCGQEKPLSGFHKARNYRLGVKYRCKVCILERHKRYYQENKDRERERVKQYYQENKGKERERQKRYRQENKDKISERRKRWQQENRDKISERQKRYRQENKDKISEQNKRYRQKNRDKIAERHKQYRQENKDKISERYKQYCQNQPSMIYEVHNTITKQVYVGQTSRGNLRWNEHKSDLRRGINKNSHLQKAWDKWGEDAFCFEVVEVLPANYSKELLREKERALMKEHISNGVPLYNVLIGK
jgi:hypothetical protein